MNKVLFLFTTTKDNELIREAIFERVWKDAALSHCPGRNHHQRGMDHSRSYEWHGVDLKCLDHF
jgi:hypothetical protein